MVAFLSAEAEQSHVPEHMPWRRRKGATILQWLGSGENKLVATAELKLLLSFTPIPVPANLAALSVAFDTGHHSNSSGSSQDSLSSRDGSSARALDRQESAQEMSDSRGSSQTQSKHAPWRPADRQHSRGLTDPHHEQQQHNPQPCQHDRHATEQSNTPMRQRPVSQITAAPPEPADAVLGGQPLSLAGESAEGRRQDSLAFGADMTGKGAASSLAPQEALGRLIQRAEQLRQMISATSAQGWPSSQSPGKSASKGVEEEGTSAADTPDAVATKQENTRANALSSAVSSIRSGDHHTQHSATPAADDPARCESKSGNLDPATAEQTQSSIGMSTAPLAGKQKRANDRALPASKLRRVAEGNTGVLCTGRILSPQKIASKQPQVKLYNSACSIGQEG